MLRVDVICLYIFPEHQLPDSNDADDAGSRSEIAILLWQGNGQSYHQVNFKIEPTLPLHLGKVGVYKKGCYCKIFGQFQDLCIIPESR